MASASAWLVGDNLGGAIFMLIWAPCVFLVLAGGGAFAGPALPATALNRAVAVRRLMGYHPKRR